MTHSWSELARHLAVRLGVRQGARVSVFVTSSEALPAVEAFVTECHRGGAIVDVVLTAEKFDESAIEHLSDDALAVPSAAELAAMEWADIHVSFRGMVRPDSSPNPRKAAILRAARGVVSTARWQHTTWCLVRIPTEGWCRLSNLDYDALLEGFFSGTLADWEKVNRAQEKLCKVLNQSSRVRVVAHDTDVTFGVEGRQWVSFAGEANLPDGEVATAPLDDLTDGQIVFPGTLWFAGVAINDLQLQFEQGVLVDFSASSGEDFVRQLVSTDEGASRVGEFGIGTNPHLTQMTGDLLIDEKILGSFHLALGRAYPECGGVNASAVHWDIVKDLRSKDASLLVDDRSLIESGEPAGDLLEVLSAWD